MPFFPLISSQPLNEVSVVWCVETEAEEGSAPTPVQPGYISTQPPSLDQDNLSDQNMTSSVTVIHPNGRYRYTRVAASV